MEAIFKGKKDLFDDLWIANSDYKWECHPVIHFDLTMPSDNTLESLKEKILYRIQRTAEEYSIELNSDHSLDRQFEEFIEKASTKMNHVVILIDEYDNPIHSLLDDNETEFKKTQIFLRGFFSQLKNLSSHIHFCFLTGITQFSKLSIFSGLNSLNDISLNESYSTIIGYTQNELEFYFSEWINKISKSKKIKKKELLEEIREWYNGYRFSYQSFDKVYNPFSILLFLFNKGDFRNYWFTSGNTTFFHQFLNKSNIAIDKVEGLLLNKDELGTDEPQAPHVGSLLFQSGYLTISSYNNLTGIMVLRFPNYEVRNSFFKFYLKSETNSNQSLFEEASAKA